MKTIAAISRELSVIPSKPNGIPIGTVIQTWSFSADNLFQDKWNELLSYQAHKDLFYFKEILSADTIEEELKTKELVISFSPIEKVKLLIRGEVKEKLGGNPKLSDLTSKLKTHIEETPIEKVKGGK